MQRLAEGIKVAALFAPGCRVKPVWFEWQREKHAITEVTYFWKDCYGSAIRLHFSVTAGRNLFELMFDSSTLDWTLEGVQF